MLRAASLLHLFSASGLASELLHGVQANAIYGASHRPPSPPTPIERASLLLSDIARYTATKCLHDFDCARLRELSSTHPQPLPAHSSAQDVAMQQLSPLCRRQRQIRWRRQDHKCPAIIPFNPRHTEIRPIGKHRCFDPMFHYYRPRL